MDKQYKHKDHEKRIYKIWEEGGHFTPKGDSKKGAYTIVLPPPNANGKLHVGHALMLAIEDLLVRWKRMQGYDALWLPGTDHAGFETQVVFEKQLAKKKKSRFDYDRDSLYKEIDKFVKDQQGVIDEQVRALGPSLDWSRPTFTLDYHVVDTVYDTFTKMASEGMIYRDNYMVNYCIHHGTTLAELEVEHKDQVTPLYYVRYKLVDRENDEPEYIVVATTRPEPIFVDTHLAINPKDKKNKWLLGRRVLNPLTDKEMEFIEDEFVDPEFGTGVVKLTPAHDKNDYEAAKSNNLPIVPAFGLDGKMIGEDAGEMKGLYITKARKKAVEILEEKDLIEKIDEKYTNTTAVCYKCGKVIEPIVLPNWFVKVEDLKKPALEAVKNKDVTIYPKSQTSKYTRWMEDMHDWPISRQIVWGIRIPAWYDVKKNPNLQVTFLKDGEIISGKISDLMKDHSLKDIASGLQTLSAPNDAEYEIYKEKPGDGYLQETDTFDTWFSSGHWPLVTLKYPDNKDFKYYYPTAVLETGWEILRFWVSRMIMFGIYLTGEAPFKDVYLHGLIRAKDGQKMSKSKGNQVDPLDFVEKFGADALRIGTIAGTAGGKDFNFPEDKIRAYRNFANKLWNMARFMNMMIDDVDGEIPSWDEKMKITEKDEEILTKLDETIKNVDKNLEKYKFAQAAETIYHFMWDDVASDYLESIKDRKDKEVALSVFRHVYIMGIKLLHPFMPFVTEAIWENIPGVFEKPLMTAKWPEARS